MTKVAVLSSHNGSGFTTLYKASLSQELDIEIVLLISNNSNALVLKNAKEYGIKNQLVNAQVNTHPDETIYTLLKESQCTHIFLSGYMKKISKQITKEFMVINSHPSLLPKYGGKGMYGRFVHEAVIKNKEKTAGVSIHEVNEVYDDGKIILQKELRVKENENVEDLENRVKALEKIAIIEAFKLYLINEKFH